MIKVEVTQEHINTGKANNTSCCPVALALREVVDGIPEVNRLCVWTRDRAYEISRKLRGWIDDFDAGRPVDPMTVIEIGEGASATLDIDA